MARNERIFGAVSSDYFGSRRGADLKQPVALLYEVVEIIIANKGETHFLP